MNSTKQSNWVLGFGIGVAIILIVSSFWLYRSHSDETEQSVEKKELPEVGQTIKQVNKGLGWLSTVIKTLH